MKKLSTLAGLAAVAFIFCSAANAQQGGQPGQPQQQYQPPPTPRTKIAILNLQHVVKSYDKWRAFEEQYKQRYKGFDAEFERIKKEGLGLKEQLAKLSPDSQEALNIKERLKQLDRQVQDLGDKAKGELLKLQDSMSIQIYAEVELAVGAYAKANELDLVMQYNDGVNPNDKTNPANIQRKMQTAPACPCTSFKAWISAKPLSTCSTSAIKRQ